MADEIIIKKEGFFEFRYDSEKLEEINSNNFVSSLRVPCEIEGDVSLRDVMINVARNYELTKFISRYTWCNGINEYHKKIFETVPQSDKIDSIVFKWYGEFYEGNNEFDLDTFEYNWNISARGKADVEFYKNLKCDAPEYEYYGMSFHFDDILDKKIVIEKTGEISCIYDNGNNIKKIERNLNITFLEFLSAIYWEIGFYGSPKESEKLWEEIEEQKDYFDTHFEHSDSIPEEFVEFNDDLFDNLNIISNVKQIIREMVYNGELFVPTFELAFGFILNKIGFSENVFNKDDIEDFRKTWLDCVVDFIKKQIREGNVKNIKDVEKIISCFLIKNEE